jgi:glutamate synthase (NADPH/NADH) small chain
LSDAELAANFADIAPPLTNDAALLEANKCLFCHDAPCTIACPTPHRRARVHQENRERESARLGRA